MGQPAKSNFKLRLSICYRLLTNQYTKSEKNSCWWVWGGDDTVMITFDAYTKYDRERYVNENK